MTTDDKYARVRADIKELKTDVRDLRGLTERVRALETKFEERDRHNTETTETETVRWLKWAVIVSLILGVAGIVLTVILR